MYCDGLTALPVHKIFKSYIFLRCGLLTIHHNAWPVVKLVYTYGYVYLNSCGLYQNEEVHQFKLYDTFISDSKWIQGQKSIHTIVNKQSHICFITNIHDIKLVSSVSPRSKSEPTHLEVKWEVLHIHLACKFYDCRW